MVKWAKGQETVFIGDILVDLDQRFSTQIAARPVFFGEKIPQPTMEFFWLIWMNQAIQSRKK